MRYYVVMKADAGSVPCSSPVIVSPSVFIIFLQPLIAQAFVFHHFFKARPQSTRIPVDVECVPQEPDRGPRQIRSAPDNRCAYAK